MDVFDQATEREEKDRAFALQMARQGEVLAAVGVCHWCDESVAPGHRFCDVDCRDLFDRHLAAEIRGGRK